MEGTIASAAGAEGARMRLARMQYTRAAERLGCNDDVIGMSVGRVGVVVCVNHGNRNVV